MPGFFSGFELKKSSFIPLAVFLFPVLIATVHHGGAVPYVLLVLFGLFLAWPAWRSLELWEKRVLLGFLVFFVLINVSLLNTQDYYQALKKLEKYSLFLLFIPMYLLLKNYQVETGRAYLFGLLLASLVMFGQAFYQTYDLALERASGAYNPLVLGNVAMLAVAILLCSLLTVAKTWWHYLLGFLAVGLALSASVMSGARGAWILLPVLLLWLLWVKRKSLGVIHLLSIVLIVFLLILSFLSLDQVSSRVDNAVEEYQQYSQQGVAEESSMGIRFELWRNSVTIWKAHPLIGTGTGDYFMDITRMVDDGQSDLPEIFGHAHNIYFDMLATSGLIGLFALLVFAQLVPFLTFHLFWKNEHDPWVRFYALSGMATIIAFAVFGLTEGWFSRNPFIRTYLMSLLVFLSSIAVRKKAGCL